MMTSYFVMLFNKVNTLYSLITNIQKHTNVHSHMVEHKEIQSFMH